MSEGGKGVQTFAQVKTRDIVAEKLNIGSGETYRKEKYIVDNKNSLTPELRNGMKENKTATESV